MAITTANPMILISQGGAATIFTWIDAQTVIATDTTAGLVGMSVLSQATLYLKVTTVSGTSPTLDVYVQKLLPDRATYQDIAHFAQSTTTGGQVMHMVTGGNKIEAQQTNALAASTVNAVPFGSEWRISMVVAGTSPSFGLSLYMEGLS